MAHADLSNNGAAGGASSGADARAWTEVVSARIDSLVEERVSIYTTRVLVGRLPQAAALVVPNEAGGAARGGERPVEGPPCTLLHVTAAGPEGRTGAKVKLYDASWSWTAEDPDLGE